MEEATNSTTPTTPPSTLLNSPASTRLSRQRRAGPGDTSHRPRPAGRRSSLLLTAECGGRAARLTDRCQEPPAVPRPADAHRTPSLPPPPGRRSPCPPRVRPSPRPRSALRPRATPLVRSLGSGARPVAQGRGAGRARRPAADRSRGSAGGTLLG